MVRKSSARLRAVPLGASAIPAQEFADHRQAALALLNGSSRLNRNAGQFLGQLSVDPSPLSDAQADWLEKLLDRAGLPPLADRGAA